MKQWVLLHHSDSQSKGPQFPSINAWHRARGFPKSSLGFYVGYHYLVEKAGNVVQARSEGEVGAHTLSTNPHYKNLNQTGIGICLAGDFTKENPTDDQIKSLRQLVKAIQQRHGIPDTGILLHREVKATACPGVDLREMLLAKTDKDLRRQLFIAERALPRTKPPRLQALRRLIARLQAQLGSFD